MTKNTKEEKKEIYNSIAPFLNLGLQMAITIVLFVLLGWWLDGQYDSSPVWTLILSFSGLAIAFYYFIRAVINFDKASRRSNSNYDNNKKQ